MDYQIIELTKKAKALAKEKFPDGFVKQDIIDCSKEVYGGFGQTQVDGSLIEKEIKTLDDVNDMGNAMANIDGHYPVGMSGCYVVGLNGGCGIECPVYLDARCEVPDEVDIKSLSEDDRKLHISLYGNDQIE